MTSDLAFAERVNRLLLDAPADEVVALHHRMADRAFRDGLWKELDGRKTPVPFTLRPRTMTQREHATLQQLAWQIRMATRRLCWLTDEYPQLQSIMPLSEEEAAWVARYRVRDRDNHQGERVFCRLDVLVQKGEADAPRMRLLELNVAGVGGMTYSHAVATAACEIVLPWLQSRAPDIQLRAPYNAPQLLLDELVEHAARVGITHRLPNLALLEDPGLYVLGGEMGRLAEIFEAAGVATVVVAPHELEATPGDGLAARGRPVDLVYRFLELGELIELEAQCGELTGVRRAFATGRMIPSVGGDLEHKSVLEVFTRPDLLSAFTSSQQAALRQCVLWTRLFRDRRTESPDGHLADLVEFTRTNRARLVIKPNRGYGGRGVVIGVAVGQCEWEAAIDTALRSPDEFVVQEFAEIDRHVLPVLEAGSLTLDDRYTSAGVYPGRSAAPIFGRFSSHPVVNLDQGGGVVPFLIQGV